MTIGVYTHDIIPYIVYHRYVAAQSLRTAPDTPDVFHAYIHNMTRSVAWPYVARLQTMLALQFTTTMVVLPKTPHATTTIPGWLGERTIPVLSLSSHPRSKLAYQLSHSISLLSSAWYDETGSAACPVQRFLCRSITRRLEGVGFLCCTICTVVGLHSFFVSFILIYTATFSPSRARTSDHRGQIQL
jgi:hypothetical protein